MLNEIRMHIVLTLAKWISTIAPDTPEGNAWLAGIADITDMYSSKSKT